jgi:hypothetical protein
MWGRVREQMVDNSVNALANLGGFANLDFHEPTP